MPRRVSWNVPPADRRNRATRRDDRASYRTMRVPHASDARPSELRTLANAEEYTRADDGERIVGTSAGARPGHAVPRCHAPKTTAMGALMERRPPLCCSRMSARRFSSSSPQAFQSHCGGEATAPRRARAAGSTCRRDARESPARLARVPVARMTTATSVRRFESTRRCVGGAFGASPSSYGFLRSRRPAPVRTSLPNTSTYSAVGTTPTLS